MKILGAILCVLFGNMCCLTLSPLQRFLLRLSKYIDYQWVDEATSAIMGLRDVDVDHVPADHTPRL
jgi:hypothetical protein